MLKNVFSTCLRPINVRGSSAQPCPLETLYFHQVLAEKADKEGKAAA